MSSAGNWVYTFASVGGTSHMKAGGACQDSCTCEVISTDNKEEILIAIASDGAGSAKWGDVGSRLICNIIKQEILGFLEKGFHLRDITRETAAGWIEIFLDEVFNIGKDRGKTIRDYACTLVGAIIGLHEEVYFQIGDGAIVVLPRHYPKEYKCIFWPQRGEYANTTFFATEEDAVDKHLKFRGTEAEEDEIINIAVFTDGIQHLALHYESRSPYPGFFKPVFKALDYLKIKNTEEINTFLEAFLSSNKINDKTDDDKTLIMAARC